MNDSTLFFIFIYFYFLCLFFFDSTLKSFWQEHAYCEINEMNAVKHLLYPSQNKNHKVLLNISQ